MTFLFAAYTAIWIILFWYIYSLSSRQRRVEEGLTRLEQKAGDLPANLKSKF
jgi:CcmD family protein